MAKAKGGKKQKRAIDIASIVGLLLALGLVIFGMSGGEEPPDFAETNPGETFSPFTMFWDLNSVLIVVGGTVGALMLMHPMAQLARIPKTLGVAFLPKSYNAPKYISSIIDSAKKARVQGLLSLEEDIATMDDPFLKRGIQMVVDSVEPDRVKAQMEAWMDTIEMRHMGEVAFYDRGAALAPGFGMIGTLVGLVQMMQSLSDPDAIGPSMAIALLTTFYGSLLANVVFTPIATKLRVRHEEEYVCMMIVYEGVIAIQGGQSPTLIQEKLTNMLSEADQKKIGGKGKKGKKGGDE